MMVSLLLLQRPNVMHRFSSTNYNTGEYAEPSVVNHIWLLQQLKLKPQQVSSIVGTFACFAKYMHQNTQQRQQLQQELAQQQEEPGGGSSSSSGGSDVDEYKQRMAKREALLKRLAEVL
jgi:hypothetical protein